VHRVGATLTQPKRAGATARQSRQEQIGYNLPVYLKGTPAVSQSRFAKFIAANSPNNRWAVIFSCVSFLSLNCCAAFSDTPTTPSESQAPQEVLKEAEQIYAEGKVKEAIARITEVLGSQEKKGWNSERITREAKFDLALFQLKAGNGSETARIIRELLIEVQLEAPMDSHFSKKAAAIYESAPDLLKAQLRDLVKRFGEAAGFDLILNRFVENTVPKNYSARLNSYCVRLTEALEPLENLHEIIDGEQLKYGDPLSSLETDVENKSDSRLSEASLNKLGVRLDSLATEAQQMPVGDARPALALYRVALAANSAGRYDQAEVFALKSIQHINGLTDEIAGLPDVQVALAYAYAKQGKIAEFKTLKSKLMNSNDISRGTRLLVTLARFTEATGNGAGALEMYKTLMDKWKRAVTSRSLSGLITITIS